MSKQSATAVASSATGRLCTSTCVSGAAYESAAEGAGRACSSAAGTGSSGSDAISDSGWLKWTRGGMTALGTIPTKWRSLKFRAK